MKTDASRPVQIAGAIGIALVMNGIVFGLGWDSADQPLPSAEWAPPGWVVGSVWLVLFGLMGAARWQTLQDETQLGRRLVEAIIVVCLAFPIYTQGLESAVVGLVGTLFTLALTVGAMWKLRGPSPRAVKLLIPLVLWLLFATSLTARAVQLRAG